MNNITYDTHYKKSLLFFIGSAIFCSTLLFGAQTAKATLGEPTPGGLRLAHNGALFTVTFDLWSTQGDLLVPFGAIRSTSDELDTEHSHYYIEDKSGDVVESGTASALLLSGEASFDNELGVYRVPQGERASFTLLAVFLTDEEDPEFKLRMHTLPFAIEDYLNNQQYNKHELQRHVSGYTALNEN